MSSASSSSPLPRDRSGADLKVDKHLPPSNEGYGQREYWDERYREEESFDWFVGYSKIRDLVLRLVGARDSILNLGLDFLSFCFAQSFVSILVVVERLGRSECH